VGNLLEDVSDPISVADVSIKKTGSIEGAVRVENLRGPFENLRVPYVTSDKRSCKKRCTTSLLFSVDIRISFLAHLGQVLRLLLLSSKKDRSCHSMSLTSFILPNYLTAPEASAKPLGLAHPA
jgi:hypothetical protein